MKKIKFVSINKLSHLIQDKPKPSRLHIPEWYKKGPFYYANGKKEKQARLIPGTGNKNLTFKHCMPLLDALNIGYIVELQSDVQCTVDDNGGYLLEWLQEVDIFTVHGENSELITPPHGYHSRVVKYLWNTLPKTPKGYSSLIVAPLGFNDLVLHAVPAVVDTDKSLQPFDLPMWIKKDYKGVIPKGTPLAQIIPFKRDNWTSSYDVNEALQKSSQTGFLSVMKGFYKNNIWQKKYYK